MRQFLFCFTLFLSTVLSAQFSIGKINKDSLLKVVETGPEDTGKVNAYLSLSRYYRTKDAEKSLDYCKQADILAEKLSFPKGRAKAENSIAVYYKGKNKNDSALKH